VFANSFLDYDRDSRDDVVAECGFSQTGKQLYVARSTGDGTFEPLLPNPSSTNGDPVLNLPRYQVFGSSAIGGSPSHGTWFSPAPFIYDIDGDSLQDVIACRSSRLLELRRRLGPGSHFDVPILMPLGAAETICDLFRPTHTFIDLDGDGTHELLTRGGDGWMALRYSLSNGEPSLTWQSVGFDDWMDSGAGRGVSFGDFNGDGLLDAWAGSERTTPSGQLAAFWINRGNGQFTSQAILRPFLPSPHQRRSTALLDYDADGRTDIIENWEHMSTGTPYYNLFLRPHVTGTGVTQSFANDIQTIDLADGTVLNAAFDLAGDIDGDGNADLFGPNTRVNFGRGSSNMVLNRVDDGVGNVVSIGYGGTYTTDCQGTNWPEICLKRMRGLVSLHREGRLGASGEPIYERSYQHSYVNGRMSITGHGWLGFDRHKVVESAVNVDRVITTTTDYEPIRRTTLDGTPTEGTAPPYIYPFAALPKKVTVEVSAVAASRQPLESAPGGYEHRTLIDNTWVIGQSTATLPTGTLPFPKLGSRITRAYERERPIFVPGQPPPPPPTDDGALLVTRTETFAVDEYGNVTSHVDIWTDPTLGSQLESTQTTAAFVPNESTWLISQPELVTITSQRYGFPSQTQEWNPNYVSGLLSSVTRAQNDDARHSMLYHRDQFGNIDQITENVATGEPPRVTVITYDSDGIFPLSVSEAGHTSQVRFDERWGEVKAAADPNGISVQHGYDGLGLLRETRDAQGTTLYSYSAVSSNSAVDTEAGPIYPRIQVLVARQALDIGEEEPAQTGSVITEIDNRGRVVRTQRQGFGGTTVVEESAYDVVGRLTGSTLPHDASETVVASTAYTYDMLNRVTRVQHSDEEIIQYQYASRVSLASAYQHWLKDLSCDLYGYGCPFGIKRTIDEENKVDVRITDHRDLVIRNIDGEHVATTDRYTSYFYGAFNRLRQIRHNATSEEAGFFSNITYDAYGRILTQNDPDTSAATYTYNGYDELKTSIDPRGQLRTYNYDLLGRRTSIVDAAGTTQWIYDNGVNGIGRLSQTISPATIQNPNGQRTNYTYEAPAETYNRGVLEEIEYIIDGTSYPVALGHDGLERTNRVSYPQGGSGTPIVAEYGYDTAGVLTGVVETGSGATRPIWTLTNAFQGYLVSGEAYGNGATTTYGYDEHRRWLESVDTSLATQSIQELRYTHYDNGRVNTRSSANGTHSYGYDPLNRLLTSTDTLSGAPPVTTTYAYDALGNLIQRGSVATVYRPMQPHLIDRVGSNSYGYDLNGNVSERSGTDIPGGIQTIQYTPFDLPESIATGFAAALTEFDYSADEERLVRRDVDTTRHFVPDLYERRVDASGATLEQRFRLYAGGRSVAEIVRSNGTDETLFFHTDHLGTVDVISTGAGAVSSQQFHAFGLPIDSATAALTRSGFTGHQHDTDLGLIDMKGRVYDPLASRFTSPDPITQAPFWSQGLNRYSYVFNDPINHTDPSGFLGQDTYSGVAIEGWGLAVAFSSATSGIEAFGPFGIVANIGLSALGSPFSGGGSRSARVSAGSAVPVTQQGAQSGPYAAGANKGDLDRLVQGVQRPSLFDPEAGALACGPAIQMCIRIAQAAMNSPAGQAAQRAVHRYGPQAANWARTQGANAASALSRLAERIAKDGLRIVEQVDDIVEIAGKVGGHQIRVLANMSREGETLFLRQAHIQGPGPGKVGVKGLFGAVREFGRSQGASKVVIEGAKRTTGAGSQKGAVPRVWEILVK
jgi:RHS repeat-associated protein